MLHQYLSKSPEFADDYAFDNAVEEILEAAKKDVRDLLDLVDYIDIHVETDDPRELFEYYLAVDLLHADDSPENLAKQYIVLEPYLEEAAVLKLEVEKEEARHYGPY